MIPNPDTISRSSAICFPILGNLVINPPASVSVFGREVYWYGILIALAFLLAIFWCVRHSKAVSLSADNVYDVVICLIPLSILGARLYYVLFRLDYYLNYPQEIIRIWEGGLAIYGGLITGVFVIFVMAKRKHFSALSMLDLIAPACMLGQAIGRWGNFMNREAYGSMTDIFCRMGLQMNNGEFVYVHPTFLYESFWNLIGFCFLSCFVAKRKRRYPGQAALLYFLWYGLGRVWIEGLRTDSLMLGNTGIRVSQLLSLLLSLTSAILLILNRRKHETD
jgi:phosphatidylglycerol:prolipoprotein diacylglycerol transferase